jgi:GNAT superfamily N-acetyltransferase
MSSAWLGSVMTNPDDRGQGYATRLTRAALDYLTALEVGCIMLDASTLGRPIYERLGFRAVYPVQTWSRTAAPQAVQAAVRPYRPGDLAGLTPLDGALFGVARPHMLHKLATPGLSWVAAEDDQVVGYLLGKPNRQGIHLGPWYHPTPAGAEALLQAALGAVEPGQLVRLNSPAPNRAAQTILARNGFQPVSNVTRMILNGTPPGDMPRQYSIAAFATG